jgi:hypothetical protein
MNRGLKHSVMTPKLHLTKAPAKLANRQAQIATYLSKQNKAEKIQSSIVGTVVIGLICAILALLNVLTKDNVVEIVATYAPPEVEEEPPDRPKDLAKNVKPKPTSASSSMARVIAAATVANVAMPIPENSDPTTPFGIDDDFNAGFGQGDGDGDGGGGMSFFGTRRKGRNVCFIVDFSLSMESDVDSGGTRIDALKVELIKSIKALDSKLNFNVIFFSHNAWTIDTPGPNYADNGWNGLNDTPFSTWYPADKANKEKFAATIQAMKAQGNTGWYAPLKMAFGMIPSPDVVYLLSDGEARDSNVVLSEMKSINSASVPIDTFAFELPGTPAYDLKEIAKMTTGSFVLYYQGKRYPGDSAKKFLSSSYDE